MKNEKEKLTTTYIGGPTVLIEVDGLRILTDPTFDAPGKTYVIPRIGAETKKLNGPGIEASQIGIIDVVLLSHDEHADNLDELGKQLLPKAKLVVTTKSGAERLGANSKGLLPFESVAFQQIRITATPARHGPPGCEPKLGHVIGFVIESTAGAFDTFYVSGDTVFYDELAQIRDRFKVRISFLNLGRVGGTGEPHFTMGADEASTLAELLDVETIVPLHYEDWAHFSEDRVHAAMKFEGKGLGSKVHWLERGVRTKLS